MITDEPGLILDKVGVNNPNVIFIVSLIVFMVDAIINFFTPVPVFSTYVIILLPVLWASIWYSGARPVFLMIFSGIFILSALINLMIYGLHKSNISDLSIILLFPTSYYYYRIHASGMSKNNIHVFLLAIAILFSFSFAGINSVSYNENREYRQSLEFSSPKVIKHEKDRLNILEYERSYNYGLFRMPHIPAYFLGLLGVFYTFLFVKDRKQIWLIIAGLLFVLTLYTGVRTFVVSMFVALMIFFIRRKTIGYFLVFLAIGLLAVIFRMPLFQVTRDTMLEPFTSLMITMVDNIDRLSRILIWKSWVIEMKQFTFYEFLIGKSFYNSIQANLVNLHRPLWFHNDFLSIIFSYGIPAVLVYIAFFVQIFRNHARVIKRHLLIFVFFMSMPVAGFINGMYYFLPVLLLFPFLYMIRQAETGKI